MGARWLPVMTLLVLVGGSAVVTVLRPGWQLHQRLLLGLSFCYLAMVAWLTFFPAGLPMFAGATKPLRHFGWVTYNLRPLAHVNPEFWANVALTLPLGALYYLAKRSWSPLGLVGAALVPGLLIEGGQLVADVLVNLNRIVDVDDWLTNSLGVLVGWGIMALVDHLAGGRLWTWGHLTRDS